MMRQMIKKPSEELFANVLFAIGVLILFVALASNVHAAQTTTLGTTDASSISVSLISQDPSPAISGNIVDLTFGIGNDGGKDVNNLVVEINPSYPFESISDNSLSQTISVIQAYQGQNNDLKNIDFKVLINRNTPPGTYDLSLSYYMQGYGVVVTENVPVTIKSSQNAEVIHIDKTVLIPGQQTPLKFVINNVGNSPLTDLTFSWSEPNNIILPVGSDNTRHIQYIGLNGSAEIDYEVIADTNAQAGLYPLNLYLTYHNSINNSNTQMTTTAGIYVGGTTDFDVAYSESSGGQTSFTIANIGSNPANSVSVSIPRQSSWSVSGSNTMIIGNLNTGDYTVASFALTRSASSFAGNRTRGNFTGQSPSQTQENPENSGNFTMSNPNAVIVQIAYTDTMGNRQITTKQVDINSAQSGNSTMLASSRSSSGQFSRTTQQSTFSKYMWYVVGFILIVALWIVYRKHKKNKLANPKAKLLDVFKNPEKGKK